MEVKQIRYCTYSVHVCTKTAMRIFNQLIILLMTSLLESFLKSSNWSLNRFYRFCENLTFKLLFLEVITRARTGVWESQGQKVTLNNRIFRIKARPVARQLNKLVEICIYRIFTPYVWIFQLSHRHSRFLFSKPESNLAQFKTRCNFSCFWSHFFVKNISYDLYMLF